MRIFYTCRCIRLPKKVNRKSWTFYENGELKDKKETKECMRKRAVLKEAS